MTYEKNVEMKNYLSKWGLQMLNRTVFDKIYILCLDFKYWKSKIPFSTKNFEIYRPIPGCNVLFLVQVFSQSILISASQRSSNWINANLIQTKFSDCLNPWQHKNSNPIQTNIFCDTTQVQTKSIWIPHGWEIIQKQILEWRELVQNKIKSE